MVDSAQMGPVVMKGSNRGPGHGGGPGNNNASFHSWHGLDGSPQASFSRQTSSRGSMRKILPKTPDMDTQMNLASKMIDRRTSTPKGYHSYGPFFLEYSLLAEYNLIRKQKMPGVYVIPSSESPLCWYGVVFVRQGIYQEGVFRFKLFIPENYPDGDCPRVVFDHPVYHPCVDPDTHELDLSRGFRRWKRNVNHLWQILLFARRAFYKIDSNASKEEQIEPRNKEAAETFEKNPDLFRRLASDCVSEWRSRLYEPPPTDDPHYISFSPYDEELHGKVRNALVSDMNKTSSEDSVMSSLPNSGRANKASVKRPSGLSYIEPGTLQIFSRDAS